MTYSTDFDLPTELSARKGGKKEMETQGKEYSEKIVVIGIGGAGNNAIEYLYSQSDYIEQSKIEKISHYILNTDSECLESKQCENRMVLGKNLLGGKGAGSIIHKGKEATEENAEDIKKIVKDADLVFITAGLGGGTGTLGSSVVAKIAKDAGAIVISLVSLPFKYENRLREATYGLRELNKNSDSLIIVDNQRIIQHYSDLSYDDGLNEANKILANAIKGIIRIIRKASKINSDFQDLKTVLETGGRSQIIYKQFVGDELGDIVNDTDNAIEAIYRKVIESPITAKAGNSDITNASAILLSLDVTKHFTQRMVDVFINKFSNPHKKEDDFNIDDILDDLDDEEMIDNVLGNYGQELPKFIFAFDVIDNDDVDNPEQNDIPRMTITVVATGISKDGTKKPKQDELFHAEPKVAPVKAVDASSIVVAAPEAARAVSPVAPQPQPIAVHTQAAQPTPTPAPAAQPAANVNGIDLSALPPELLQQIALSIQNGAFPGVPAQVTTAAPARPVQPQAIPTPVTQPRHIPAPRVDDDDYINDTPSVDE